MDVRKTLVGDFKSADRNDGVLLHLGTLAADALPCPAGDLGSHVGPHEFGGDCLEGPLDPWVPEAVYYVEDSSSPCLRDKRTRWSVSYIDNDVLVANLDFLKIQAGSRFA